MIPGTWYTLRLERIHYENDRTRIFHFSIKGPEFPLWKPGQFFVCDLPLGEKRAQRWRSYSIANPCTEGRQVEFCISFKEGGAASQFYFSDVREGDTIRCKGPEGNFTLPDHSGMPLTMVCTGTGIAPFRAMLSDIANRGHQYASVDLIFGVRNESEILYRKEIALWCSTIPRFRAIICLSRQHELPAPEHPGLVYHHGHVHQCYDSLLQQMEADRSQAQFLLCGWSAMIDQAVAALVTQHKVAGKNIRYELYG